MNSKNEIAEAILILIKTLIKWLLIGIIVFAGAWFALYQIGEYYDWYRHERHADKVDVRFFIGEYMEMEAVCEGNSYGYIIRNNSEKIVENVRFKVIAKKPGYSNIINHEDTRIESSKILKPGEKYASCFSVFFSPEEWMSIKDMAVELYTQDKWVDFAD